MLGFGGNQHCYKSASAFTYKCSVFNFASVLWVSVANILVDRVSIFPSHAKFTMSLKNLLRIVTFVILLVAVTYVAQKAARHFLSGKFNNIEMLFFDVKIVC